MQQILDTFLESSGWTVDPFSKCNFRRLELERAFTLNLFHEEATVLYLFDCLLVS